MVLMSYLKWRIISFCPVFQLKQKQIIKKKMDELTNDATFRGRNKNKKITIVLEDA